MARRNLPTKSTTRTKNRKDDARVALFRMFYIDPNSPSFANCRASAIKAGYSEQYADNITVQMPKWLDDLLQDDAVMRADMLKKAQKNMKSVVDESKPENIEEKKLWFRASEYLSGTLGKDFYSTRTELTDKGGRRLFRGEDRDARKIELGSLFKGVQSAPGDAK